MVRAPLSHYFDGSSHILVAKRKQSHGFTRIKHRLKKCHSHNRIIFRSIEVENSLFPLRLVANPVLFFY